MAKINDGGPAFPQFDVVAGERDGHGDIIDAYTTASGGMSLRDYFAAKAMPEASRQVSLGITEYRLTELFGKSRTGILNEEMIAAISYQIADAMLKAREASHG